MFNSKFGIILITEKYGNLWSYGTLFNLFRRNSPVYSPVMSVSELPGKGMRDFVSERIVLVRLMMIPGGNIAFFPILSGQFTSFIARLYNGLFPSGN